MTSQINEQLPAATVPQPNTVKNAFEAPEWYFDKLNYRVRLRAEIVGELAAGLSFQRILDIGCGDGSISLPLLTANRRLTLQDLSGAMLRRAACKVPAHLARNVEYIEGDFGQATPSAEAPDLVICLGVLAYVNCPGPFLAKLGSVMAPGGHAFIECSDGAHLLGRLSATYSRFTRLLWRPKVDIELFSRSRAEIESLLRMAGLQIVGSYRYSMPLPIIRRFFNQQFHYKVNRALHGDAVQNRAAWLGTECIFHCQKPL